MIKTCNQPFKICSLMYSCDGIQDVKNGMRVDPGRSFRHIPGITRVISIKLGGSVDDNPV
jgi:hypothetical protein